MKLILMGGPGSGKGTQAKILKDYYGIAHISTGDILREERASGTELGKLATSYMDKGALVPDGVIIDMVKARIAKPDCAKGYILDGFPRTVAQLEAMEEAGIGVDKAVLLDVSDAVMAERMASRAEKEGRADDANPETIKNRVRTFHEQTDHAVAAYDKLGKLLKVNGAQGLEQVTVDIKARLEGEF